jgi:hypothetical protein
MKWIRALAPTLLALAVVALVLARVDVSRVAGQEFVRVLELAPHDVEVGDRLTLIGDGFPSGKAARVVFRGTLYRPGMAPVYGAQVAATGNVVTPERVEVEFNEGAERLFASTADGLVHTTFEGDVEVGFAAAAVGAPPVSGVLAGTTLDVRPSIAADDAEHGRDGAQVLLALGIQATPVGSGLSVDSVQRGSRAEAAGLATGDVLARFDGVRVASRADVVPAPGERQATLRLFRGREVLERSVSVEGVAATLPFARTRGLVLVLSALVALFLFAAPLPVPIARRLQRAATRLRSRLGPAPTTTARTWLRALGTIVSDAWPSSAPVAVADAAAIGLLSTFSFGPTLVATRVDVALLFGMAASALTAAAWACQSTTWRGLRCAAQVAWQHVPSAVALATVIVGAGSLKFQEIARAQGGLPWEWLAFRNPATLVAMVVVAAAGLIALQSRQRGAIERLLDDDRLDSPPKVPAVRALLRFHRTVMAGIAAALFLGGWILPGLSASGQDGSTGLQFLGALWFLGKTGLVLFAVSCARLASPRASVEERSIQAAKVMLPLAFAALGGSLVWSRWGLCATSQGVVSGVLAVTACLLSVALAERIRFALAHAHGDGHVSPFI